MPQITLEYTGNLEAPDFQATFSELHRILTDAGGVRLDNCKSRALRRDDFFVGDGADRHAFVHLTLRLLAGRDPNWKRDVGQKFLDVLIRAFRQDIEHKDVQITVTIEDIVRATYFKYPEGTLGDSADVGRKAS